MTRARAFLREYKAKTWESLLVYSVVCIACACKSRRGAQAVQAYRKGVSALSAVIRMWTCIPRLTVTWLARRNSCPTSSELPITRPFVIHNEIRAAQVQDCESLGGFQSRQMALAAVAPSLSGDGVDRGEVSPRVEEISGDGGHHSSGDVWERCRMGNSSPLSFPLGDGGQALARAGCR